VAGARDGELLPRKPGFAPAWMVVSVRLRRRAGAPERLSRKRMILMAVALLLAASFGAAAVGRLLFASWSIGLGGRATLTGPWAGSLTTRQGAEHGLWLALEYKERPGPSYRTGGGAMGSTNLQGQATLCTPKGDRYEYEVSGRADPLGGIEALWLEYGDRGLSGFDLQLTGAWRDGALHLTTAKNPFRPDGRLLAARTANRGDPLNPDYYFLPATLTARARTAFEATCRRIQA
jgi:hypothetical protein